MKLESNYFFGQIPIEIEMNEEEIDYIQQRFPAPELPSGQNVFSIDDQTAGNQVKQRLLLNDYEVRLTRTNKNFLRLSFSNNAGMIQAKMWDNQGMINRVLPLLEEYSVFDVEAIVDDYNNQKSLTINRLTPVDEKINPFSLLPYTDEDYNHLTIELYSYLDQLDEPYSTLAKETLFLFWSDFSIAPAAKGHHHNYLGGLLKHTVGLMRIARYILNEQKGHIEAVITLINLVEKSYKKDLYLAYKNNEPLNYASTWNQTIDHLYTMTTGAMNFKDQSPDYNILIVSILFHDLGKILEYDHAGLSHKAFEVLFPTANRESLETRKQAGISMDPLGVMIGHIPYGFLLFSKLLEQFNISLDIDAVHQISHCILCHHGLPEWGSAVKQPQTIEGYLIHIVDYLDSRYENAK
ncbi:HD domain-containing protein [Amphibacillus xylanus]|nr:HD domain-containing protein [Amphibacillus xylanus]